MVPALMPEQVGKSVLEIATAERPEYQSYGLSAAGLSPLTAAPER
jgi:hypothetical protein